MKKRNLFIILLGLSIMFLGCGFIYGMTSAEVTNHFETGIVDIDLTEYQKVGNTETLYTPAPSLVPGQIVSKIPRIHNNGNDCYIRAKVTLYAPETDGMDPEDLALIEIGGFSDQWEKSDDGYYYYTEILPHGEDVDIFQWVNFPTDMPENAMGKRFNIDVDVDAIQSKNFTPQFDLAAPWGDIEILACEKSGQYDISSFKQSDTQVFQVIYQGNAEKLIAQGTDFFANFPYLMPGDTYRDTATLVNDGDADIKLYFRSEATEDSELLEKILLKITTDINGETKVVYEGNLKAAELSDDVILGTVKGNTTGDFHFEISVPAELNNKYTILSSHVKWIFSTEPIPEPPAEGHPATGDLSHIHYYMGLLAISLVMICFLIAVSVKKRKEEQHG